MDAQRQFLVAHGGRPSISLRILPVRAGSDPPWLNTSVSLYEVIGDFVLVGRPQRCQFSQPRDRELHVSCCFAGIILCPTLVRTLQLHNLTAPSSSDNHLCTMRTNNIWKYFRHGLVLANNAHREQGLRELPKLLTHMSCTTLGAGGRS